MYGIFNYMYHKLKPNVAINIPYMEHLGKEMMRKQHGKPWKLGGFAAPTSRGKFCAFA